MIDRLKELQENIEKYDDGEDIYIINHFAVIDMEVPFTIDFFKEIDVLRNLINKIIQLINDVDYFQRVMLTSQVVIGIKEKLEEKMNEIKSLAHTIRMKIQQIQHKQEIYNPTGEKNVRQRIIEEQISVIIKHFCSIINKYYQSVMIHRERCIQRIQRQNELMGVIKTDDEIEQILENQRFSMFPDIIIETYQTKQNFDLMKLRHQELLELENGIQEMHDMFFDIACLIESQRDQITTIAEKAALATDYVIKSDDIIGARKVSHCFHLKLYRNRCASWFSRLFLSCF